ncbi:MAG: SDR family NAD(P)-dependent oxidoreductase [Nitrospinota bacterium]
MKLQGETALVTGSTRGIGRAIAERLGREGARLIVNGRSEERAEKTAAELRARGFEARAAAADLEDLAQVERLAARVRADWGRVDILVNNAGFNDPKLFFDFDAATLERMWAINFRAPFFLTQALAREMAAARSGRIVNLCSSTTRMAAPRMTLYSATKAALEAWTRCLAVELGPYGVRVNAVAPGPTLTDLSRPVYEIPEYREAVTQRTPLGRWGEPKDVAGAVVFLCAEESAWLTGQTLAVSGGYTMW